MSQDSNEFKNTGKFAQQKETRFKKRHQLGGRDEKGVGTDLPELSSLDVHKHTSGSVTRGHHAPGMKDQPNVVVGRSAKFSAQETIFGAFNKDSV